MFVFKNSFITISILVIAIWVMPATPEPPADYEIARGYCKAILGVSYCNFQNTLDDYRGTFRSKFQVFSRNPRQFIGYLKLIRDTLNIDFEGGIPDETKMVDLLCSFAVKYLKFIISNALSETPIDFFCESEINEFNYSTFLKNLITANDTRYYERLVLYNVNVSDLTRY